MNLPSTLYLGRHWLFDHSLPLGLVVLALLLGQWLFRRQLDRPQRLALGAVALGLGLTLGGAGLLEVIARNQAAHQAFPKGHKHSTAHSFGGLELTGRVSVKEGGTLSGPALVFIASATPKNGVDTVGATAWDDCVKQVRTDARGAFKFEGLDPTLTFSIRAVANGFMPGTADRVDPAKGRMVHILLDPVTVPDAAPDHTLGGRVLDARGKPIGGALVEVNGLETRDGGGRFGGYNGLDREAVTDQDGVFRLTDQQAFEMMMVKVSAPWYADKIFDRLASGTPHDLVLTEGAELHGRVRLNGRPLAGVSVGLAGANRAMGAFLGHFEIGTDAQGNFDFVNLPPDGDFRLYTIMRTMKNQGAAPMQTVHTGKDGDTTEVGVLAVEPGHRLAGSVVVAGGEPLPSDARLDVGRDIGWDNLQVKLGPKGEFEVAGIPSEIINLVVRPRGYHLSVRNASLDPLNGFRLTGRVDHDLTNLVILLEKGPEGRPDHRNMDPDYQEMRNRPLAGTEGGEDHSREWSVSGHVFDRDSKELLRNFRVTPGQTDDFNRTAWKTLFAVDGTNGGYQTYFSKRAAQPLLKVEARGYLPVSVPLISQNCSNVDVNLQRGSGPSGTVLTAEGKPAGGVTLILLNDDFNQGSLNSAGELSAYGDKSAMQTADAEGNFAFQPMLGMNALVAASADGFAQTTLEAFTAHKTVRLDPFGKITGTLKRTSGPGTNEQLDVLFGDGPGGRPINLSISALTDAQGAFAFDRVPPGQLRITYRERMQQGNGWMNQTLQDVELKPGQTLTVSITAPDLSATPAGNSYQRPPEPKRVTGVEIKGVVLLPNGQPASDADVALQVEGKYLSLGRGALEDNGLREAGLLVSTKPDGSFTLPLYEGAQSVIAVNQEGYVQVGLDQLKQNPRVTLQKWGRIEGTLRVNHHPGTNETVQLSGPMSRWRVPHPPVAAERKRPNAAHPSQAALPPPMYNSADFQAKTDDQGRFVLAFVPPGEQILQRRIPLGAGSWTQTPVGTVRVPPGETVVTNVGGGQVDATGHVKHAGAIDAADG